MSEDTTQPGVDIIQQAADLDTIDQVLCRMCHTDEEIAAVKRVLGIEVEENRVTDAFTPARPPVPEFRPRVNHLERAHAAVARYTTWVDSYPDDDPTPLLERERVLKNARLDLQRLEGGS